MNITIRPLKVLLSFSALTPLPRLQAFHSLQAILIETPFARCARLGFFQMKMEGFNGKSDGKHMGVFIYEVYIKHLWNINITIYIYINMFSCFNVPNHGGKNIGTHMKVLRNQENLWWFPWMGYLKIDGLQWNILFEWMIWGYPYFWKPPNEHHLYMGSFPLLIQSWPFYFCFFTLVVCGRYFDLLFFGKYC